MKKQDCSTLALVIAIAALSICAQATDYNILRTFNPSAGGIFPQGKLVADRNGNLYGATTTSGNSGHGTASFGTIFELSPNGQGGWQYSVIYACALTDCGSPAGSLAIDGSGNLYGVGQQNATIFELTRGGSGTWTATVLHQFTFAEGLGPSPVILDSDGNLYGEDQFGGSDNLGYVFKLSHSASGWTLTDLHDFIGQDGDASQGLQSPGLTMDKAGNLFGVTNGGGTSTNCSGGCGVVLELTNTSGTWSETVLHSFDGSDGANPDSPVLLDGGGSLYGAATAGGKYGLGVAYKLVAGKLRVLHNFSGAHLDGAYPNTAFVMDAAGNLYGTTLAGGGGPSNCTAQGDAGCGTVFELAPLGGEWKISILHAFSGKRDGAFPQGVIEVSGTLYGAANGGGRLDDGVVFGISGFAAARE